MGAMDEIRPLARVVSAAPGVAGDAAEHAKALVDNVQAP